MSSLKDIMNMEPVEPQAYRKSSGPAQTQDSQVLSAHPSSSQASSETLQTPTNVRQIVPPLTKRKPRRKLSSPPTFLDDPHSSVVMGEDKTTFSQIAESSHSNASISPRQPFRNFNRTIDVPVKYTPITGRVSRAKKGVPVHTCDICTPIKTFTRAEHLRRHQLSHQKPAYPCTFEHCDRAFHRPDLLARHQHRHEAEAKKPYALTGARSRTSLNPSSSQVFSRTRKDPAEGSTADLELLSTSNTFGVVLTKTGSKPVTEGFRAIKCSLAPLRVRDTNHDPLTDIRPYDTLDTQRSFGQTDSSFTAAYCAVRPGSLGLSPTAPSDFIGMGHEVNRTPFSHYTTPSLPHLSIPGEAFHSGPSYPQGDSPWCSSASDSAYSTQSDGSRNGLQWPIMDHSATVATTPHWPLAAMTPQRSAPDITDPAPNNLRSPMGQLGSAYRSHGAPSSAHPNLPMTGFEGYYQMDSVGIPAISIYTKDGLNYFQFSPRQFSMPEW